MDGILDRFRFRSTMTDNEAAFDAHERRTAVFSIVKRLCHVFLECRLQEQPADLRAKSPLHDSILQKGSHQFPGAFPKFQDYIPCKSIRDDDIKFSRHHIAAFRIARKRNDLLCGKRLIRFRDQRAPLRRLFPDIEKTDLRLLDTRDLRRIDIAQKSILDIRLQLRLRTRAGIDQVCIAALLVRDRRQDGRTLDALDTADAEKSCRNGCPSRSRSHESSALPLSHKTSADRDRRILLFAVRQPRMLSHLDHF